jgi:hypothetical protein
VLLVSWLIAGWNNKMLHRKKMINFINENICQQAANIESIATLEREGSKGSLDRKWEKEMVFYHCSVELLF